MAKKRRKNKRRSAKLRRKRTSAKPRRRARPTAPRRSVHQRARRLQPRKPAKIVDPQLAQAMKLYEEAMVYFNKQSFRRAKDIFQKVVAGPSRELAERARVHLAICEQRLQRPAPVQLRGADDHYHYAVSLINMGNYLEARARLDKARKLAPKADYIYYALASVAALTGEADEALNYLAQAIKLRPENRYHARNDADFKLLEDDPRFHELVASERMAGSDLGELRA